MLAATLITTFIDPQVSARLRTVVLHDGPRRVSRCAGLVQCRCYDLTCSMLRWGIRLTGDTCFGFDTMSALRLIVSLVLLSLAWWSNRGPAPSDSNA